VKTTVIKIDPYCEQRKSSVGTLVSGNIRFVRIFAWVNSLEKRRQKTVGSHVNARLELLFLVFENNRVKVNRDRPYAVM